MLRLLFSFYDTRGDATQVGPRDEELRISLEKAQELANEPNAPLGKYLNLVQVPSAAIRSRVA
jgi:hypothetical protein